MHSSDDKALRRVEDSEEGLEEDGAPVCHGQDGRHPGERQQGQHYAGAPERGPEDSSRGSIRVTPQGTGGGDESRPALGLGPLSCPRLAGLHTPRPQQCPQADRGRGAKGRETENRDREQRTAAGPEQGPGEVGGTNTVGLSQRRRRDGDGEGGKSRWERRRGGRQMQML